MKSRDELEVRSLVVEVLAELVDHAPDRRTDWRSLVEADPSLRGLLTSVSGAVRHDVNGLSSGRDDMTNESTSPPTPDLAVMHVERGVVTERLVAKAAAAMSRIVVARGVAITPLARDAAKQARVRIERST